MSNSLVPFDFNQYPLLKVQPKYDVEKLRQFSQAANERKILMRRINELEKIMRDNSELALWTHTRRTGEVVPVPDMDSEELQQVLSYSGGSDHGQYLEAELRHRSEDDE